MSNRIPLAFVCCGSFNPITNMHLRMFEIAKNYFDSNDKYEVLTGIVSPVSDGYKKKGLIEASHRVEMARLAVKNSDWIKLHTFEADNPVWLPTLEVLHYYKNYLDQYHGKDIKLMLLCGGDLVETFNIPNVWKTEHIEEILSKFGLVVIKRLGSNPEQLIYETDILYKHKHNIKVVTDWITNDISSTKIRRSLSRNESVKYLIPDDVCDYIKQNKLYQNPN